LNERLSRKPEPLTEDESIALANIKNRLVHYYGDAAQMRIWSNEAGGITVLITIPTSNREAGLT
jgi:sensor histidine kinase YesM